QAPYVVYAHLLLVIALAAQNRLDTARAACVRLIQLAPELSDAHCSLGSIEARSGHLEAAAKAYERALERRDGPAFVPTDRPTAAARLNTRSPIITAIWPGRKCCSTVPTDGSHRSTISACRTSASSSAWEIGSSPAACTACRVGEPTSTSAF